MRQHGVPIGKRLLQVRALDEPATVDPGLLRGDADPRVAAPDQVTVEETPVGPDVDPAGHVVPLDEHGAAEPLGIDGTPHEQARRERRRVGRLRLPMAVGIALADEAVRLGRAREEELLLDVYRESARSYVPAGIGHGPSSGRTVVVVLMVLLDLISEPASTNGE